MIVSVQVSVQSAHPPACNKGFRLQQGVIEQVHPFQVRFIRRRPLASNEFVPDMNRGACWNNGSLVSALARLVLCLGCAVWTSGSASSAEFAQSFRGRSYDAKQFRPTGGNTHRLIRADT